MEKKESIYDWWFSKRIEDFPPEELAKRFKVVMELDFWKKIVVLPYIGTEEVVEYATPELIALCPATGYPDIYEISIRYAPGGKIPELKSLKFYLMSFKDVPISHEHLASKIFDEFVQVVEPAERHDGMNYRTACLLTLKVAIRGGIATTITKGWLPW